MTSCKQTEYYKQICHFIPSNERVGLRFTELYLAMPAYEKSEQTFTAKPKPFVLTKKCWEHINTTCTLTRATNQTSTTYWGLLRWWETSRRCVDCCCGSVQILGCIGKELTDVFQSVHQGILGETNENSVRWFRAHSLSLFHPLGRDAERIWPT